MNRTKLLMLGVVSVKNSLGSLVVSLVNSSGLFSSAPNKFEAMVETADYFIENPEKSANFYPLNL